MASRESFHYNIEAPPKHPQAWCVGRDPPPAPQESGGMDAKVVAHDSGSTSTASGGAGPKDPLRPAVQASWMLSGDTATQYGKSADAPLPGLGSQPEASVGFQARVHQGTGELPGPSSTANIPVLPDIARLKDSRRDIPLTCQVLGCGQSLVGHADYYQRYRVCKPHLKGPALIVEGLPQRFCQQCGRFHPLDAFDGDKRNCRARLEQHNSRRRKVFTTTQASRRPAGKREEPLHSAGPTSGDWAGDAHLASSAPSQDVMQPHLAGLPPSLIMDLQADNLAQESMAQRQASSESALGLLERIFSEPARGPYGWRHQPQQSEDPHQGQRPMALGPAGSRDLGRGQTSNAMSNEMSQLLGLWSNAGLTSEDLGRMLSSTASRQLSASVPSTLAGALLSEPPRAPLPSVRLWPPEGGGSAGGSSHSPFQRTGPDPAGGSGYDAAGRHLVPTIPRAGFAPPHELGAGPGGPGGAGYSPLLPPVAHAGAGWSSGEGPSNPFQLAEHSGGRGVAGARPGAAPPPAERGSPGAGAGEERPPKRIALARTAAFVPTRPVTHAPALTQYQQLRARQAELAQELAANSSRQAAMAAAMLAGGELPPSPPARQRLPPPAAAAAGGQDPGTAELQALLRQVLAAAGAGGGGPQASQQLLLAALLGMQSRERGRAPLQDAGGHPDLLQMLQTTLVGGRQGPAAQDPGEGGPQA
ncbi:hypothetical protein ACKKBF_B17735 [Auxenochlorella protothecoides x Auxenochlorella symbiontica]